MSLSHDLESGEHPRYGPERPPEGDLPDLPDLPDEEDLHQNLSEINTLWTVVDKAKTSGPRSREAQEWVLSRYQYAIVRYLRATLPDLDAVDEVYQEYARLLADGGFANVDPARGKFRRYLKRTLSNLVNDYFRRARKLRHVSIDANFAEPEARPEPEPFDDRDFMSAWRHRLLERAWKGLLQYEKRTAKPLHTILSYRVAHRDVRSYQMAEIFAEQLGPSASSSKVRKLLHQARGLYSDLLLEAVAESMSSPSAEALEEELIELDLLKHCRDSLENWKRRHPEN